MPLTGNYIQTKIFNRGVYGMSYVQWFDGTFNTLAGFRRGDYVSDRFQQPAGGIARWLSRATKTNFNGGTAAVAAGAANATPLTITALSTPGGTYFANPDPISGRIAAGAVAADILRGNGDAANLAAHGPILTGATMLPIGKLQLDKSLAGISTPGTIVATRVGDKTTGYPECSVSVTNLYSFAGENPLKGVQVGGTISASQGNRRY